MDTSLESGSIGVGFAIPADTASRIAAKPWPPHQHEAGTGQAGPGPFRAPRVRMIRR